MKRIYHTALFVIFFILAFYVGLSFYKEKKVEVVGYSSELEKIYLKEKYRDKYAELSWVSGETFKEFNTSIFDSLHFLDVVYSGEYLSYLELFSGEKKCCYKEFERLHTRLQTVVSSSIFTEEELLDVLGYSLILPKISESNEFKKRAWIYNASSLSDVVAIYNGVLPTLERFTFSQRAFLRNLLEGFVLEGSLQDFKNHVAYEGGGFLFLQDNIECFDTSFLLYICRMAKAYSP